MKRVLLSGAVFALVAALSGPALAATTVTEHEKRATETFVDELPCVGEAEITITYNAVFHMTENSRSFHTTATLAGRFVADPLDASLPTYRGRFTQRFGENGRISEPHENGTFTFSVTGRAADGSRIRFHEVAHFTVNDNGLIVEFVKTRC